PLIRLNWRGRSESGRQVPVPRARPRTVPDTTLGRIRCPAFTRTYLKIAEEDNEASELYEAEEVPGVVFPTDEDAALPLNPSKEALHEPASHIAAQPSPILRGRLASVAAMRRDHLDAVLAQLLIEWIAIVGAIANQILRLGLDHVEVEA